MYYTKSTTNLAKDAEEINDEEFKIGNVYPTEQHSVNTKAKLYKKSCVL